MKIDKKIFAHCSITLYDDTKKNEGYTIVEMDYDNKVSAHTINLNETYRLVEMITERVHSLFKEADAPEDIDDGLTKL